MQISTPGARRLSILVIMLVLLGASAAAGAASVWTGPLVTFTKVGADNPQLVKDILTPDVSLARGTAGILFNPERELSAGTISPAGTAWAFDTPIGNPDGAAFAAANFDALTFLPFLAAAGGSALGVPPGPGIPNVVLNHPGVVHLLDDDIYFDIQFLQWTNPFAGTVVSYQRTSAPVPVPTPLALLLPGIVLSWTLPARKRPGRSALRTRAQQTLNEITQGVRT